MIFQRVHRNVAVTQRRGRYTLTTGSGSDLIWLTGLGDDGDVVTDFTPGLDRMVVFLLLDGVVTRAVAFSQGIRALVAPG